MDATLPALEALADGRAAMSRARARSGTEPGSHRGARTFAALAIPNYRRYYAGQASR